MKTFRPLLVLILVGLALSSCEQLPLLLSGEESTSHTSVFQLDSMEVLRTPDERFDQLVDYPFESNYVSVMPGHLRMHYLDEGPTNGKVVLLLHGNPTWTYGLRKIIPLLVERGYRVIAPDLIGFGKSDKPASREVHTYDNQERWVTSFVRKLDLRGVHLHVQDWGGILGLRVAIRNPRRFATVAASNTFLPTGDIVTDNFLFWRDSISQVVPDYSIVMQTITVDELSPEEVAAFDAPFPSEEYKAGPRELPLRVPTDPNDPEALENQRLLTKWAQWRKPFLVLFSEDDAITSGADRVLIETIPGAEGQPHATLPDARHFIREDQPEEVAKRLSDFIESAS